MILMLSCQKDKNNNCDLTITENERIFEFKHQATGDTFVAWTSNLTVIEQLENQLALPENERLMHIHGKIEALPTDCELNQKWSWYFPPNDWALAEISIELCDGTPQFVEENLDEFVNIVEAYCPWSSFVLKEIK